MSLNLGCKFEVFSSTFSYTGIVIFADSAYKNSVYEIERQVKFALS